MSTVNGNIQPGYPNTLVDLVGELEQAPEPKPEPKKKTAKKAGAKE